MDSWRLLGKHMTGQALERNGNDYSMQSLERRIRLNRESGYGLEKGTGAQLNLLALFCQKHHLLPGDDVTLYEGKPWITVDGRVKLLRRNHRDEYRGFVQRPLSNDEKIEWGWSPKDIVVETTIRTVTYGEIKAYGRVSLAEAQGTSVQGVRHNPVARFQPVEMAMKRSLAVLTNSQNFSHHQNKPQGPRPDGARRPPSPSGGVEARRAPLAAGLAGGEMRSDMNDLQAEGSRTSALPGSRNQ